MQAVYDQMIVLEKGGCEWPPLCINSKAGAVSVDTKQLVTPSNW